MHTKGHVPNSAMYEVPGVLAASHCEFVFVSVDDRSICEELLVVYVIDENVWVGDTETLVKSSDCLLGEFGQPVMVALEPSDEK